MGRGLSDLQRSVLALAYHNRQQGNDPYHAPDVYTAEVLAHHWGRPLPTWLSYAADGRRLVTQPRRQARGTATPTQHADLSRAARRLIDRGLLTRDESGWGFSLTSAGVIAATAARSSDP